MPNEPEKRIEKLLRDVAQKRRAEAASGPEFGLHAATRRLLQSEVARRFPRQAPARSEAPRRWSAAFWPRLVEACVLVTLLAVVVSVFVPALRHGKTRVQLARNEAAQPGVPPAPASPAPAEPSTLAESASGNMVAENKPADNRSADQADREVKSSRTRRAFAASAPAAAPAAARDSSTMDKKLADAPATGGRLLSGETFELNQASEAAKAEPGFVQQRFIQVPPLAKSKRSSEKTTGTPALASFEVQQSGSNLWVIDNDGSVYTGAVQVAELPNRKLQTDKLESPKAAEEQSVAANFLLGTAPLASELAAQRFFRVAGTNRTLQQPVVFTGNLTYLTNGAVVGKLQGSLAGKDTDGPGPAAPLFNTRISGQAMIGTNQVISVNAVPTP